MIEIGKVLLVEDVDDHALVLSTLLRNQGLEVSLAKNGESAIHRIKSSEFDLLIMDLMMPVSSGYEILNYLKLTGNGTPVIIMTSAFGIERRLQEGGYVFRKVLTKPLDLHSFVETVRSYVRE